MGNLNACKGQRERNSHEGLADLRHAQQVVAYVVVDQLCGGKKRTVSKAKARV